VAATIDAGIEPAERVLVITRILDAPRQLVFSAWTDPAHLAHWLGPRGFAASNVRLDVRPGGGWRACLRPEDGGRALWMGGTYREVVAPERLVFTFAWDDEEGEPGHETLMRLDFADAGRGTRMTMRQAVFQTVEDRDGHSLGWTSSFERLDEHLRNC